MSDLNLSGQNCVPWRSLVWSLVFAPVAAVRAEEGWGVGWVAAVRVDAGWVEEGWVAGWVAAAVKEAGWVVAAVRVAGLQAGGRADGALLGTHCPLGEHASTSARCRNCRRPAGQPPGLACATRLELHPAGSSFTCPLTQAVCALP